MAGIDYKKLAIILGLIASMGAAAAAVETWMGWPPYANARALDDLRIEVAESSAASLLFRIQILRAQINAKRAAGRDASGDLSRLSSACVAFQQQTGVRPLECG